MARVLIFLILHEIPHLHLLWAEVMYVPLILVEQHKQFLRIGLSTGGLLERLTR
jgi:hypothetical protein